MIDCLYDTFRSWSCLGSVYIISDTHFGDSQCREIDPLWPSPEAHIALLRNYITRDDTVIHLGDVGDPRYMEKIPGTKVLIMGNHDKRSDCAPYFQEIFDGPLYIGKKILLSHEPILIPGAVNIHGHVHNDGISGGNVMRFGLSEFAGMNRAANVCGYLPLNLGKAIRHGLLSGVKDIHRLTINAAVERKNSPDYAEETEESE